MASKNISAALLILLGMLGAPAAMAAPVTFEFTGYLSEDPSEPQLASRFSAGDIISGSYTFDSTTPGIDGFFALIDYSVTVGDYTATYDPAEYVGEIYVANDEISIYDTLVDEYVVMSDVSGTNVGSLVALSSSFNLVDFTATALSSDDLPLDASLLASFGEGLFYMSFIDPLTYDTYDLNGVITNVQTSVVPLPGALVLFLSGLASVFISKKRFGHSA